MKIIKRVVEIGNGAAVYVPREYKGMEVVVIIPEGISEIKKNILSRLIEFMPNILGVYLYGSYARQEQKKNSDIDILIITKEKDKEIKELFSDIDVRILTLEEIRKSIKHFPFFILPILKESEVLLNSDLIEELKNSKFDIRKFRWHFEDVKRILKIIKTFLELDDKDIAPSHIYSLIMRIRVCYMLESLLKDKIFSNKSVKEILLNYGLSEKEYEKFYSIYGKIRDNEEINEKINEKIDKEEIVKLMGVLMNYCKKLEKEVQEYGKKKEKIRKRN